jgi:hypothetical protein
MSDIRRLSGIDLTLSLCRAFPVSAVNQARLKIVVLGVRARKLATSEALGDASTSALLLSQQLGG